MRDLSKIAAVAWLVGLATLSVFASAREPMRGRSLDEVLTELSRSGVHVVYTERLVRPEMRVELEPVATEPSALLNQLLSPHSLRAEPAVGGRYRVVRGTPPVVERLVGRVVSAVDGRAIAGAHLRLGTDGFVMLSSEGGRFQGELHSAFFDLPDPSIWTVSAPGFEAKTLQISRGQGEGLEVRLDPVVLVGEKVEVRAGRPWILGQELSSLVLEREDLLALPHVGNDVFRSLTLLPGVSSNDASAQLSVRGGRHDEVLIRLDGVEILEPYHLRDFNSFLSILSPQMIGNVELLTGGFPAEFGDRLSGVLDLTTVEADWPRHQYVGLTLLDLELGLSGAGSKSNWLVTLRAGSLEIPFSLADQVERPSFGDAFVKLDRDIDASHSLRGSLLLALDRLAFSEIDEEELRQFRTSYRNGYAWLADQKVLNDSFFVETRLFSTRIERDRQGLEENAEGGFVRPEDHGGFDLLDDRRLISAGISQDWYKRLGDRAVVKWGADVRRLDASYNYAYNLRFDDPLARIREPQPGGITDFDRSFRGWQYAGYISGRFELNRRLDVELGLRFDRDTVLDDNHTEHPRFSATYQLGSRARLQAAWGQYSQSQRLYELQVEDGVSEFAETEQADYGSLGFETTFAGSGVGAQRRPVTLRLELYRRQVGNPRSRFENLFDPISKVPELEADRIPFIPDRTTSEGAELFLGGAIGKYVDWFAGYTYADARDRIDGEKVPRSNDQTHTLRLDVAWHTPWLWDVQVAWRSHTGWPTTAVDASFRNVDGETVIWPELGPINGERLADYHRLDLRLARNWAVGKASQLEFFLQIQNALGRANLRGYEIEFEAGENNDVEVILDPQTWGGLIPTVGLRWRK